MARWNVYRRAGIVTRYVQPWAARRPNGMYSTFATWREAYDYADREARTTYRQPGTGV